MPFCVFSLFCITLPLALLSLPITNSSLPLPRDDPLPHDHTLRASFGLCFDCPLHTILAIPLGYQCSHLHVRCIQYKSQSYLHLEQEKLIMIAQLQYQYSTRDILHDGPEWLQKILFLLEGKGPKYGVSKMWSHMWLQCDYVTSISYCIHAHSSQQQESNTVSIQ